MNILDFIKDNFLFLDGGMGTLLQSRGLRPGELPECWNLSHPEEITAIHRAYYDAGSHVVNSNTFGANCLKFSDAELSSIVCAAIKNVRTAADQSQSSQPKWVALDIGPLGRLLKPYGDLDFEDAVSVFAKTIRLGVKYGADLIFIETMNDSYETKAALLAAKENSNLPVFVSNAYGEDGKLMTGANPAAMVALLEGMGADAIGVNCSLGPKALTPVVNEYLKYASVPVLLKPNAGLPRAAEGKTFYDVWPEEFAADVVDLMQKGVRIAGGCCGTTPEHIAALTRTADFSPVPMTGKNHTLVSSYTHAVFFGEKPVLIGERINPTGKKRFREALKTGDAVIGNRTKIKVVKNKVAPPFRTAECEIYFGKGISASSSVLNTAVTLGIVDKSGAWFSYNDVRIGQGRDNARRYLEENPAILEEIKAKVLKATGVYGSVEDTAEEK